ncbi:MAG: hypothetical protein FJZ89_11200 [Chloroflexi bacterium]|nr:hypothetical protein [Chloroflexota bacterium]
MPFVLASVFIAITLARVASLTADIMGAGYLGWFFAAGLGFGVLLYAYWLRSKALYGRARIGLLFLVLVDGGFNLAEVYRHMIAQGTWNDGLLKAAGITYGVFPTLACLLLGWLAGGIALLPPSPMAKTAVIPRVKLWIAAQFDNALPAPVDNGKTEATPQLTEVNLLTQAQFLALPNAAMMSPAEVMARCGISQRSAYRWLAKAGAQGQ